MAVLDVRTTEGSGADLVAVGTLRVGPVAGRSPVTVAGLGSTPLFDHAVEGAPLVLAPGGTVDLTVRLRAARCDPHAVAEDKVGFGPLLTVRGDARPGTTRSRPGGVARCWHTGGGDPATAPTPPGAP